MNRYIASPAVHAQKAGAAARKVLEPRRKEIERRLRKSTATLDKLTLTLSQSAPIDVTSCDVGSKVNSVLDYCSSIQNFIEETQPVVHKIETLAAKPFPATESSSSIPEAKADDVDNEAHVSPAASRLLARLDEMDIRLDDMEVNSLLRAVTEPTSVKVNRMMDEAIDARRRERGIAEPLSVDSVLNQLESTDRAQGDELVRQAGITAGAIAAQQQQKHEYDTMMSQLSEVCTSSTFLFYLAGI